MKSKNFIITLVVYPFDVMVSLNQTDEQLKKELEKFGCEWDDDMKIVGMGRAMISPTNHSLIRLRNYPVTNVDYSHLQHEIFHIVTFIMSNIGIKFSILKNDEAYAYLIQHLTKEIYDRI